MDAKVQKNPHLIIISEEIFLVNKIENAINTGLAFCFVNSVAKIEQVSHLQRIGYGVQDAVFCIVIHQCY
jgi:hypothetical protein